MPETRVLRSENFPDLADELIYPRPSEQKLEWLRKHGGRTKSFAPGEALYEHAVREVDEAGYLLCGDAAAECPGHLCWPLSEREPYLPETIRPGVFAADDVLAA